METWLATPSQQRPPVLGPSFAAVAMLARLARVQLPMSPGQERVVAGEEVVRSSRHGVELFEPSVGSLSASHQPTHFRQQAQTP